MLYAEIHTPSGVGDVPQPAECKLTGHTIDAPAPFHNRCRVVRLHQGEHLYFGAERVDAGDHWLQVGDREQRPPYSLSRVVGHIWFTAPGEGSRLLVENLSANNTVRLESPRLPRPTTLYPVAEANEDDHRGDVLGTAIAAVQTAATTVTVANRSTSFTLWIEVPIEPVPAPARPQTASPSQAHDPHDQPEVDDAALRLQLAAAENYPILREFVDSAPVAERLRSSESLREFLHQHGRQYLGQGPDEAWRVFAEAVLSNVKAGKPTNDIHRLVLEGIGTPPHKEPRWYTGLVIKQLHPAREPSDSRGGAVNAVNDLIPDVKAHWKFRRAQLLWYLHRDRGLGLGRELD